MRKLLLFFFALLTGVGGAWATTPNILALPQPGKIYYIIGYNATQDRSAYLYADGTSLKGNISYTEAGEFAYLWLCVKTEAGYTFQNLSTGKYMKAPQAPSGTSYQASVSNTEATSSFNLLADVQNASCVSFASIEETASNVRWMAVSLTESKAVDKLTSSYNYYSSQWTTDFLLKEYAAKTLSHNQYYYIYCDNDDSETSGTDRPQYIYNNSGNFYLQTDKSQVSLTNYAWRAQQLSAGHFSFKNDTKYLSFHTLADAAYDWQTDKEDAYGAGRVMLWGVAKARYMLQNYASTSTPNTGGISQTKSYSKSGEWSQDYMFVVAPQTNVYRVAIKIEGGSESDAVFTFDGIDYSGDCSIYVDGSNLPGTTTISLKSSSSDYTFKGFYLEDGTSLGTTIDVSSLSADKGVKAVFYPFKLSSNFATANWYYMQINGDWAVTDDEAPYPMAATKQISKNALWAFVGTAVDGFYLINYASGDGMKLNMNTPANMQTAAGWNICHVLFEGGNMYFYNDPSNPYYLISNTNLTVNTDKANGAITLETVDWAELAKAVVDDYASTHALGEYFGASEELVDATKTAIDGYGSAFNKAMFEGTTADLSGLTKYPTTGYYRIYNSDRGRYMGTNDGTPSTLDDATGASTVVRLVYDDKGKTYKIQMQGLELNAPAYNATMVLSGSGADFTAEGTAGIGAFKNGTYYAHAGNSGWDPAYALVGYLAPASDPASGWTVTDATCCVTLHGDDDTTPTYYYATFCAPFSYTVDGATAYTLEDMGTYLKPTEIGGEVPAGTPVLLKGTSDAATLTIGSGYAATPLTGTGLTGTYLATSIVGGTDYVLGIDEGVVGFYHYGSNSIGANRAYVNASGSGVKGFVIDWSGETGINSVENVQSERVTYNLAGQRVTKAQKGIFIVNGKKVVK